MSEMMSGNKIAKSEQTKRNITHAYLQLIEKKQWDKITVKELCAAANITRGTFYQYYGDIYELMEQIQQNLLDDLTTMYETTKPQTHDTFPMEDFLEKYDYEPPAMYLAWFDFCKEHREGMHALLHQTNGDTYFEKKLKNILHKYINGMMDHDGLPRDDLRAYFVKACAELHLVSVRNWFDGGDSEFLSIMEIVNLLNTMRVGAGYLTYKRVVSAEEFEAKMNITEDKNTSKSKQIG